MRSGRKKQQIMTPELASLLEAVRRDPAPTVRSLMASTGGNSTSVIMARLQRLAALGHVILETRGKQTVIYSGEEFCAAWDMVARISGNPEA